MNAQQAPSSPGQSALEEPSQCACTSAHEKARQAKTTSAAANSSDKAPSSGVGHQAFRQRVAAASCTTGGGRAAIMDERTTWSTSASLVAEQAPVGDVDGERDRQVDRCVQQHHEQHGL